MKSIDDIDSFFSSDIDEDIFGEKTYISFNFKIKFKIIEDNNKYLLSINYLYKSLLKDINKKIIDKLINLFPFNIKDINFLNLEDYILYREYIANFTIIYCEEDDIFDIFLDKLD